MIHQRHVIVTAPLMDNWGDYSSKPVRSSFPGQGLYLGPCKGRGAKA